LKWVEQIAHSDSVIYLSLRRHASGQGDYNCIERPCLRSSICDPILFWRAELTEWRHRRVCCDP
jgi:hypothetical protein